MLTISAKYDASVWVQIPDAFPHRDFSDAATWATSVGARLAANQEDVHIDVPLLLTELQRTVTDYDADMLFACVPNGEVMVEMVRLDVSRAEGTPDDVVAQIVAADADHLTAPPEIAPITAESLGPGHRVVRFMQTDGQLRGVFMSLRLVYRVADLDVMLGFDTFDIQSGAMLVPWVEQLADGLAVM